MRRGFTLLELLISIAILSIVMTMATLSYRGVMQGSQAAEAKLSQQVDLDRAWFILDNDLLNFRDRPISNSFGSNEAGLLCSEYGNISLALTRSGHRVFPKPDQPITQTHLSRVEYAINGDGELVRTQYRFVDRADDDKTERVLLGGVRRLQCSLKTSEDLDNPKPKSLTLRMETDTLGSYERRYALRSGW